MCLSSFAADERIQKLKKRLKAIRREIRAVEDGLKSVDAEANNQSGIDQPAEGSLQETGRQGDLQRATMLERLSALEAKHAQLEVSNVKLHWQQQLPVQLNQQLIDAETSLVHECSNAFAEVASLMQHIASYSHGTLHPQKGQS